MACPKYSRHFNDLTSFPPPSSHFFGRGASRVDTLDKVSASSVCREPFRLVSNYATRRARARNGATTSLHTLPPLGIAVVIFKSAPSQPGAQDETRCHRLAQSPTKRAEQQTRRVRKNIRKLKIQIDRTVSSSYSHSHSSSCSCLSYIECLKSCEARITSQDVVDFGSGSSSELPPVAAPVPAYPRPRVRALRAGCPTAASLWTASGPGGHVGVHRPTLE